MAKPLILFQHGWAYSSGIWTSWTDDLQDFNIALADRGYFKEKHQDLSLKNKLRANTAITHSMGLLLLPMNLFSELKRLIIISGFEEFHPPVLTARVHSERVLQRMIHTFDKNPRDVLHEFYRNCFYPESQNFRIPDYMNKLDLFDDLALLNKIKLQTKMLQSIPEILILHGGMDKIVKPSQAEILHGHLPNSKFEVCKNGGHMFFLTHKSWCMKRVMPMLEPLK